jgi:hypothetical protein
MNTSQRNFLIKKIEETKNIRIDSLKHSMTDPPSLSNYLLHAVMSGTFEIRSNDEIKKMITKKALTSSTRHDNWMGTNSAYNRSSDISFKPEDFFIIPEEYTKLYNEHKQKDDKIQEEIRNIIIQTDSLITRIQLASDKTLQTMINEIDDMGNISLMDTKIKALTQ